MSRVLLADYPRKSTRRSLGPLQRIFSRLENGINASPSRAFVALTAFYIIAVFSLSSLKLLWVDELITLHVARLGSVAAIWHALAQGADPNPPLTYLLVHLCRGIFGEHEFALRLPAMAGYWIGCLSLFLYLRCRLPATWALAGTVLSITMAAFDYSYESRSYGILYGFAMLAFLCWSRAVDAALLPFRRRIAILGMALALAAGITTNYFAVLAFLPIAAGELTRTIRRMYEPGRWLTILSGEANPGPLKAADIRVWLALLLAATPLLAFRSMIAHSIAQFTPYAWNKVSFNQVVHSYTEMVEVILYPILALFVFGLMVHLFARLCPDCRGMILPRWIGALVTQARSFRQTIPIHEAVGIFFLMVYPILGYIVASIRGGMLSPRFVIPVCFGFAIAAVLTAFRLFGHVPQAGIFLLCFCTAWFIARESVVGYWYLEQKQSFSNVLGYLPEAELAVPPGSPMVISDPLMALTFQHYAPLALTARIVFPVDFSAIRLYRHDDSLEENFWAGRNLIYTLPIVPLATFQHSAGKYLILASDGNWLIEDLRHHRYPVQRLPINTCAGDIGGFTPLSHGVPVFYASSGDTIFNGTLASDLVPQPFEVAANLP